MTSEKLSSIKVVILLYSLLISHVDKDPKHLYLMYANRNMFHFHFSSFIKSYQGQNKSFNNSSLPVVFRELWRESIIFLSNTGNYGRFGLLKKTRCVNLIQQDVHRKMSIATHFQWLFECFSVN